MSFFFRALPLFTVLFLATAMSLPIALAAPAGRAVAMPPHTPRGLSACAQPLTANGGYAPKASEVIDYDVEVMGMDIGTLELSVARQGTYKGEPVTEYQSIMKVNGSLAALMPLEGSAAALVSDDRNLPVQAMSRYRWTMMKSQEMQTYSTSGLEVRSRRIAGDERDEEKRTFHAPVFDMVSGFYFLRRLPRGSTGCAMIYNSQKAYTVWLEPKGEELVATPYGRRMADKILVRYASDEAKTVRRALIWVSQDERRVPYKAEVLNRYHPRVNLKSYRE